MASAGTASEDASRQAPSRTPGRNHHRRNGTSRKPVQGDLGKLALDVPRDRAVTFEPQLLPKHERRLRGFDEKILELYAKGMTTRDIQLTCLTDLKNRGVDDFLVVCVDGLSGFPEALQAVQPENRVQLCIVHLVAPR